jgi:dUTP pyrophosphatase
MKDESYAARWPRATKFQFQQTLAKSRSSGMVMRMLTIPIKRAAHSTGLPLPSKMTPHSAGFDLPAAISDPLILNPGDIKLVPCGFHIALPTGYEAQIRPRSGLASRNGITLVNSPGTIDADYRGEVMVPLINLGRQAFTVERGMRIAQMLIAAVPQVQLVEAESLDETTRGAGGFGHTGQR